MSETQAPYRLTPEPVRVSESERMFLERQRRNLLGILGEIDKRLGIRPPGDYVIRWVPKKR